MSALRIIQSTFFKRAPHPDLLLADQDKLSVAAGQVLKVRSALQVGDHCWVELVEPLGALGKLGYFYCPHVQVKLQELRAVWLTTTDSQVLQSRRNLEQGLKTLSDLGFNTLYPVVWNQGFTLYPSLVAEAFTGAAVNPQPNFAQRDLLAEVIEIAKPYRFRVIPWFEYGLKVPANAPLATRNRHWLTTDPQGNFLRNGLVWLNPTHPEVQQFITDLIADVAARYEIAGVQLDDNFGLPVELGYDPFTQALYRQDYPRQSMPLAPRHPRRLQWLSDQISLLFQRIASAVKANQDGVISLSPNPWEFSRQNYAVDWQHWIQEGWVEELVLQDYRMDLSAFTAELNKPEIRAACARIPTAVGILTGLRTKPVSFSQIAQQVQVTRRKPFAGISCFFYETLLHEQLSPTKVSRSLANLQALFPLQMDKELE